MLDATDDHSDNVEMLSSQINKLSEESKKEQQSMLIKVKDLHQKHTSTKAQNWWT
jgi:restriction endonuclease S subunit